MTDIYTPLFRDLIEQLNGDKSIVQPYRNFAVADAKRLLATIHEGQHMTNRKPEGSEPDWVKEFPCTCPAGARRADCPVPEHAAAARNAKRGVT